MPRNEAGVYVKPAGTAAIPNTVIASAPYNLLQNDMADALTESLPRTGVAPMLAPLPMGGNPITDLGATSSASGAATVGQVGHVASRDTVAELIADEVLSYVPGAGLQVVEEGQIITAQGFRYEVAASDAVDWHVETAGGVKLRVSSDNPFLRPEMFAALGSENDEMPALQLAIDTAASYSRWLEVSKVHWIKVLDYPYADGDPYRNGLDVPSGSRIRFVGDGEIKVLPCYTQHLQILNLFECEDVEIISPKLDGKKQDNSFDPSIVGSNQMFCMGIAMRAAKRVRVVAPNISDCRGDGIFMWRPLGGEDYSCCEDIEVIAPRIDGCSRQGISVSSVRGCRIVGPHISNIGPIGPGAGIDIEPESEFDVIQGLVIDNPRTENCAFGIMTYLAHLTADSLPVDVVINDHFDEGSDVAFQPGQIRPGSRGAVRYNRGIGYRAAGTVTFSAREHSADGVRTFLKDCIAITQGDNAIGFRLEPFQNDPRAWSVGNIEVEGFSCYSDIGETLPLRGMLIREGGSQGIKDVSIINPRRIVVQEVEANRNTKLGIEAGSEGANISGLNILDQFEELKSTRPTQTLNRFFWPSVIDAEYPSGFTAQLITLVAVPGAVVKIRNFVNSDSHLTIAPGSGARIIPLAPGEESIRSAVPGSTITLRCLSTTEWIVENQTGAWTVV